MPPKKSTRAPPTDRRTRSAAARDPTSPEQSTSGAQTRAPRPLRSPKYYRTPYREFASDTESSPEDNFQRSVHFQDTSTPARQRTTSEPDLTGSQLFTSASSDFYGFSDQDTINADSDNTINPDLIETSNSDTNMSDDEDPQGNAVGGNLPQPIQPPQVPAAPLIPADFIQFMQWQAKQQEEAEARREAREERLRQDSERIRREDRARIDAERIEAETQQARIRQQERLESEERLERIRIEAEERQERLRQEERRENTERQERIRLEVEQAHREMRENSETQIQALAEQLRILTASKTAHPKPPAQKLEQFDLEKDGHTFKQWRSRWDTQVEFYGLNDMPDEDEKNKAQFYLLKPALSTQTLAWLDNRNLPEENAEKPDFILDHIDAYLKESVNVTMKVVDLVTMQRFPHEKIDALLARINENASYVDWETITKDPRDFLSLIALQVAVSPELRIRMWQDKAKTYLEAAMICKQDELAHLNSKMTKKDGTINATSSYKHSQNQERQAQQPHHGGFKSQQPYSQGGFNNSRSGHSNANQSSRPPYSSSYSNTTGQTMPYNGSQAQAYNSNPNKFQSQTPAANQERGRSHTREGDGSRARSRSKRSYPGLSQDQCYSCGKAADHPRHTCPAFLKTCDNCGKTGHIKKVCQQPQLQQQAQGFQSQPHQTSQLQAGVLTAVQAGPPQSETQGFIGAISGASKNRKIVSPDHLFVRELNSEIANPSRGQINTIDYKCSPEEKQAINKSKKTAGGYVEIPPLPEDFCTKYDTAGRDCVLRNRARQMRINIDILSKVANTGYTSTTTKQTSVVEPNIASINDAYEFADIEVLDTIAVSFKDITTNSSFVLDILPDTGANVTAVSQSQAEPLQVEPTTIELRSADNTSFKVLGRAKCVLSIKGMEAPEYVYVISDLTKPLVSRRALKALGLLHPNWPHQQPGIFAIEAPSAPQNNTSSKETATLSNTEEPPFITQTTIDNTTNQELAVNTAEMTTPKNQTKRIESGCGPELDALINEYPDLFDGKCTPMHSGDYVIELEPEAKPISSGACRNIQLPYLPALKKELEGLVDQGIIEKITHATPWLHPIVVVPKKGTSDIRLCVDFTKINKFVKRPTNPQPTPWEVVRNLPTGTRHFAVFDALKGYHQIPLAEESRDLTAFMTPFGRYRYKRLAMGMNSAQDVFTLRYGNAIDKATDGLRATEDTLLRGSTTQELIDNTRKFFDACRQNGITLNMKKIQWDKREVLFAGFLLDPTGYKLDPSLNKALSEFPVPTNQTDVRSFCGLANQLSNSSQDIATALIPLSPLLKKGRMFQWLPEHQTAFETARSILSSEKTLAYYSPSRQTRLITDASRLNGLGFVLKQLQDDDIWRPVQAGSRFLSSAETRYAMIELEMLAIAWACAKTANFIEGLPLQQFEIWTDHNPLISILSNQALPDISNKRLQRLKMKVDHLTFTIKWIKGKDNVEADVLSRHPCSQPSKEDQLDEEADAIVCVLSLDVNITSNNKTGHDNGNRQTLNPEAESFTPSNNIKTSGTISNIHSVNQITFEMAGTISVMNLNAKDNSDERLQELKAFSNNDTTYSEIVNHVSKGFPNLKTSEIPTPWQPYFKVQETLHIDADGFLMNNGKLVVPQALVPTYLKRLLGMHQGGPKMLARARQTLWWPHMARDINNIAKTCLPCEESKPSNPAELILSHEPALYPFQFCHMDLAQEEGRFYLITVDQYSGYPNIHALGKTCKTKQVIDATAHFVSLFSIPETIYSDGGPQFLEEGEFDKWCQEWGIKLVRSSPYMPRSNGVAEAAVKEMKKLIRANLTSTGTIDMQSTLTGLMMFRNTPRFPTGRSPAQLLFGRQIRDSLPCPRDCLLPQFRFDSEESFHRQEVSRQTGPTKELTLLKPKATVRVQNPITKKWDQTGEIVDFGINQREYLIKIGDKVIRRNRHFLKEYTAEATPAWKQPVQAPIQQEQENSLNITPPTDAEPTVYNAPPPTPIGVTTRRSSPSSRLLSTATTSTMNNSGSILSTSPLTTGNKFPGMPTAVKFGTEAIKPFCKDDPIRIPENTATVKPPIIKVRSYSTPLTNSNAIPIDLSLKHTKIRQLPQNLSLLQLAMRAKANPEVEQDFYKTFTENSTDTTPSPISTTQIYRHPNSAKRVNNFESAAARLLRLRQTIQTSATTANQDPWLTQSSTARPWQTLTSSN